MKRSTSKGQATLTKKDLGFLRLLNQGSYTSSSTLQLPQRDKLRAILGFFETVYFLIDECYRRLKKRKTDVGKTAIENLANALSGKFPDVSIDFSRVNILGGTLASPCGTMSQGEEDPGKLSFSWCRSTLSNSHPTDELMAMMYCPATQGFCCETSLGITRADGFCIIDVPEGFSGQEVHVWLAYRSADLKHNSNSSYMGKVLIPKTTDYENN